MKGTYPTGQMASDNPAVSPRRARATAALRAAWIALLVALYALHLLHLRADFPNFSPWMDYAKYTDEGWYGNAAIAYFINGSWFVPGDLNTAVALPVWPLLEWVVFHFTGMSLLAARGLVVAVFGANLLAIYTVARLACRREAQAGRISAAAAEWTPLFAVTLLAASSFVYCFSRLAILEPLLTLFLLLSWLLVLKLPPAGAHRLRRSAMEVAIGILLCLMVLTKTTAIFLLPSVCYLLWRQAESWRAFLRSAGVTALAGILPMAAYYRLLVEPHYVDDYHYLFSVNIYPHPDTVSGWLATAWYALHGALWIDPVLATLALILLALSVVWLRSLWRNTLYGTAVVAALGYIFFIGYHNNMQPRYYSLVAFPLCLAVALASAALLRRQRLLGAVAFAVAALTVGWNLHRTIGYALHPEFTWVNAANGVASYIDQHSNGNRMLLSISGNDISLMTGLPSICDDFGTLDLPHRIHRYQPGWYAAWNELDPGTLEDLQTQMSLEEVARFPAFDDPDRNVLILYKLHPLPPAKQHWEDDSYDGLETASAK